jgi:hypothetical protein
MSRIRRRRALSTSGRVAPPELRAIWKRRADMLRERCRGIEDGTRTAPPEPFTPAWDAYWAEVLRYQRERDALFEEERRLCIAMGWPGPSRSPAAPVPAPRPTCAHTYERRKREKCPLEQASKGPKATHPFNELQEPEIG